jgi:outer membrane autotransporter protein
MQMNGQQIATGATPTVTLAVGVHTVTLRVTDNDGLQGTDTVEITVEAVELPTVTIEKVSGDGLSGSIGETLGFTIRVLDQGNPIESVPVDWSVTPTQVGDLDNSTTTTNASGEAFNNLTINETGVIRVRAAIPGGTGSVDFVVNSLADTPGLPPNEKEVAGALDSACPALAEKAELTAPEQDLLNTCNSLVTGDPGTVGTALRVLAPEEVTAQGTASVEAAEIQVMNVNTRLNALRAGGSGADLSGLTLNYDGLTLPASVFQELFFGYASGVAAGDEDGDASFAGKWGVFVNGAIDFGDKDSTSQETGFEFDTEGITIGVDYRFTDRFIAGGALGYSGHESDFDSSSGDLDMDTWSMSAYATYYQSNQVYVDGLIQVGTNDYDTRRRINASGSPDQFGVGDTDGEAVSISIGSGYEYSRGAFTFGPYGRLSYTRAEVDSYTEKASDPAAPGSGSVLSIGGQSIRSLATVFGGHFSYAISTSRGVFMPQLRFEWEHEFEDDSRSIDSHFVHDPTNTSFKIGTDDPDRDFFNLGLGLSATFAKRKSGFLFYETKLGHDDLKHDSLTAGFRFEF